MFPDILERSLIDVTQDNAAACADEDVAERIDMNALGAKKIRFAVHCSEGFDRFLFNQFC